MQVPFFLPSGYGVAEGNGATAPSPMKGLLSGAKRQPRSITRRFGKKGAAPRDLWQIAGLPPQPIRYLFMQVPFFLPSGYGVAEGNGAKAPSPMKGLFSGAKRQPRSITRRSYGSNPAPATNKVPAKTGTFLFTFGVWSCRRQRGESPKPDERAPQRSEATATKYNPKVVWFKSCPRNHIVHP